MLGFCYLYYLSHHIPTMDPQISIYLTRLLSRPYFLVSLQFMMFMAVFVLAYVIWLMIEILNKHIVRLYLPCVNILNNVNNLEKIVNNLEKNIKHNNELLSKCIIIEKSSKPDVNNSLLQLINKYADHMNNQKSNDESLNSNNSSGSLNSSESN
jgi:hypothetical protein